MHMLDEILPGDELMLQFCRHLSRRYPLQGKKDAGYDGGGTKVAHWMSDT
jgi:hypothetical protein